MEGTDTDYKTRSLCENVFELSAIAESMQIEGVIAVEDSRELAHCVIDWAEEFEKTFDPEKGDHLMGMEDFARMKLLGTFRREQDSTPSPLNPRQEILDFIQFEDATSQVWLWAVTAEEMRSSPDRLMQVQNSLYFDPYEGYNTDDLYSALDQEFGVNPELTGTEQDHELDCDSECLGCERSCADRIEMSL